MLEEEEEEDEEEADEDVIEEEEDDVTNLPWSVIYLYTMPVFEWQPGSVKVIDQSITENQ